MNESISPMEFVVTKMEVEADDDIPEDGINMSIINEIKARRHLWDARHKLYKDSEVKKKSWTEVARKLGVREPFLKTRWRSLRDRYMKEKRRETQQNKTGELRKTRPWTMMPTLDFLNKVAPTSPDQDDSKLDEKEDCDESIPPVDLVDNGGGEPQQPGQVPPLNNVPTYLIINPDNTIQCLPGVQLPVAKPRPLRRIEPATSESPRNVTLAVPPSPSVAGSSTMGAQVQHVQSIKPIPRLAPASASAQAAQGNRKPDSQTPESESSERYFYLSIAKEMESRSTKVRLKMRKIISDALLSLYEEEEERSQQEG